MAEEKRVYEIQETKQSQNVLNLDTNEDSTISIIVKKVVFKANVPLAERLRVMQSLVSPVENQVIALQKFFESSSYADSKEKALAGGNFLTQQIRSAITGIMGNLPQFSENSAKANFERWLAGYKLGKESAKQLLARAVATAKGAEFTDL